jgi:dihydrolipoamide dehydrogenase
MEAHFDIVVIGSGPGGYPAAIKAAQEGKRVALIEAGEVGGTCLNRGCIPSKALLSYAALWKKISRAEEFGIFVENARFDYRLMAQKKEQVVAHVRKNLEGLLKANNITLIKGYGKFLSAKEIKVSGEEEAFLIADKTIIATGSEPKEIAAFPTNGTTIHTSTSLLQLETLPKSIAIIGGGVIGCEFASLMRAFGVEVHIIEMLDRLIPMESIAVSSALQKAFEKKGIHLHLHSLVEKIEKRPSSLLLHLAEKKEVEAEMALVSIGRRLNTERIGLEKIGVVLTKEGRIQVNDKMETTVPGIYAIGDIASSHLLAHVASHQGLVAASNACGKEKRIHYNAVPSVIFTDPEIGTVGLSLEQAIQEGYDATLGAFPFSALGKAQAALETEGFAQIVVEKRTGKLLGAQVVGHDAGTLVAEMGIAIANEMTLDCITETIHAHPTVAEAWLEAALVASGTPLHLPPSKKRRA